MLVSLVIAVAAIGVAVTFILLAVNAKPKIDAIPKRHTIVTTAMPLPEAVLQLRSLVGKHKYRFALEDPQRQVFVLEDDLSAMSYGNFYPCFVQAVDGGTQITVGLQTKAPQWGPIPARRLKNFVEAVVEAVQGTVSP